MCAATGPFDIDGTAWQLDQHFLAGVLVTIAVDKTGIAPPVVEHDGHRYTVRIVDAVAAGKTRRKPRALPPPRTVAFDPAGALLDEFAGRPPRHRDSEGS